MILTVTLLTSGLADIGHRFWDSTGAWVGARVNTPWVEQVALKGTYISADLTIPPTAFGVHVDSLAQSTLYFLSAPLTEFGVTSSADLNIQAIYDLLDRMVHLGIVSGSQFSRNALARTPIRGQRIS